ncbi:TPA: hypothetical protein ACNVAS_002432 [Citrobacter amalonaticus]|uniref:hypothetical protein n=1 Tax=Citrobacter sp. TaxID=1896336 RepID=UPI0030B1FECF|nr:hypothetical protein [Citrobacter amalonaticus]
MKSTRREFVKKTFLLSLLPIAFSEKSIAIERSHTNNRRMVMSENQTSHVVIEVSPDGIDNLAVNPPVYSSIQSALDSITDNSEYKRYRIELLEGEHVAREVLLKDYVDITRSTKAINKVVVKYDFQSAEPAGVRDIFKTATNPYQSVDHFPIRCKISGLNIIGSNMNYAIHCDFNDHSEIDIKIDDCMMVNNKNGADICDYAFGVGMYGGQRFTINDCLFYGNFNALETVPEKKQGAGWIVHNRANQQLPCRIEFNNCKSLKGFYGGRIVDFGSGQEDVIAINGGVLFGELANLLCFDNGVKGTVTPSLTVTGSVPMRRVQLSQKVDNIGTIYNCSFPIIITGFSQLYVAAEYIEDGDLVVENAYGSRVSKTGKTSYYFQPAGVALNSSAVGGRVSVQTSGIAAVKYEQSLGEIQPGSAVTNGKITGSEGKVCAATQGSNVIGAALVSTAFSKTVTPGRAWVYLDYSGRYN